MSARFTVAADGYGDLAVWSGAIDDEHPRLLLSRAQMGRSPEAEELWQLLVAAIGRDVRTAEAVAQLDAISRDTDKEGAHQLVDALLLFFAPQEVNDAYKRAVERVGGWWFA